MPYIIALVVIAILILSMFRVVSESNLYVVERLGKYKRTMAAGFRFKLPFFEKVVKKISLKEQVVDFPPQSVITKDNVSMQIDTVIYYRVCDARLYTYGVENPLFAIETLTATTLRNIIGELELDDTLTSRDVINAKMCEILDGATDAWGIKITRVELKNITPPREIQAAMEKQMKAERERRETLLEAEGHKQAIVKREEGNKEARILEAEGKRAAVIAEAKAKAKAISLVYEAQAKGLQTIKDVVGADGAMLLKKLEALEKVGNRRATKIVVPTELANSASDLTFKGEMLGLEKTMDINEDPIPVPVDEHIDECCDELNGDEIPQIPTTPIADEQMRQTIISNLRKVTTATLKECKDACEKVGYKFADALAYLQSNGK